MSVNSAFSNSSATVAGTDVDRYRGTQALVSRAEGLG